VRWLLQEPFLQLWENCYATLVEVASRLCTLFSLGSKRVSHSLFLREFQYIRWSLPKVAFQRCSIKSAWKGRHSDTSSFLLAQTHSSTCTRLGPNSWFTWIQVRWRSCAELKELCESDLLASHVSFRGPHYKNYIYFSSRMVTLLIRVDRATERIMRSSKFLRQRCSIKGTGSCQRLHGKCLI
jgi:hypothetical protein